MVEYRYCDYTDQHRDCRSAWRLGSFNMMTMRTYVTLLFCLALMSTSGLAQTNANLTKSFSLALVCGELGYDTGVGLEFGTPSVFTNRISFRLLAYKNWLEVYKAQRNHWADYETVTLSSVYTLISAERARSYFELGTIAIFPDHKFSDKKFKQGVTCSLGVELFVVSDSNFHICYYFSGGASSLKLYAEKLENKPRYGSGFVFNNGFRFYF
jgi:hypothetical protein